jgi:hypothetical protein
MRRFSDMVTVPSFFRIGAAEEGIDGEATKLVYSALHGETSNIRGAPNG